MASGLNNHESRFSRTELLFGRDGMERLFRARVAVFGLGGVGGYVVEALVRSGVGALDLVDHDRVTESNLNRQILATAETIGQYKAEVARKRALSVNPDAVIRAYTVFYTPETAGQFDFTRYDYVVDAIDTVTGKLALIEQARAAGTRIVSSMGAGNKRDPSLLQISDIYETSVCPLARVMRRELRKRGVERLKVVWSRETPITPRNADSASDSATPASASDVSDGVTFKNAPSVSDSVTPGNASQDAPSVSDSAYRKPIPGSTAFVPAAAGLLLAAEVVRDLLT